MKTEAPDEAAMRQSVRLILGRRNVRLAYVSEQGKFFVISSHADSWWASALASRREVEVVTEEGSLRLFPREISSTEEAGGVRKRFMDKYGCDRTGRWFPVESRYFELSPAPGAEADSMKYGDWLSAEFDRMAPTYEGKILGSHLGTYLRERTVSIMSDTFEPGSVLLEIGCGTGIETISMARRGYRITAVDASKGMLEVLERRAREAGVSDRIRTLCSMSSTGLAMIQGEYGRHSFDGAYSTFGALNSDPDIRGTARLISDFLRPGGYMVAVAYNSISVAEMIFSLFTGNMSGMFSRLRNPVRAAESGMCVDSWMYTPFKLASNMGTGFSMVKGIGLSSIFPAARTGGRMEKLYANRRLVAFVDSILGRFLLTRFFSDTYLVVMRKDEA